MNMSLALIRCPKCKEESYIKNWQVGISKSGELVKVCPECREEIII